MKIISVQIRSFKNVLDSTEVALQPDVTCLVGKNESGKTAFLHALYRLNPSRPNVGFNIQRQYPAWLEKRHRLQGKDLAAVVPVEAVFQLEAADIAKIEGRFGSGVLKSAKLTVTRDYDNNSIFDFEIDQAAVIRHVVTKSGLVGE